MLGKKVPVVHITLDAGDWHDVISAKHHMPVSHRQTEPFP